MNLKRYSGFTLVELLVVIAIIGVLIALLLPAVQQAREAARRMECKNNMKQIGLAMHNYHDSLGSFPPGAISTTPTADHNLGNSGSWSADMSRAPWTVLILPYVEESALHDSFDFGKTFAWAFNQNLSVHGASSYDSSNNNNHIYQTKSMPKYICPSFTTGRFPTLSYHAICGGGPTPNDQDQYNGHNGYSGRVYFNNGVFWRNSKTRFADITDGTTNVLIVGETIYSMKGNTCCEMTTWASGYRHTGNDPLLVGTSAAVRQINSGPDVNGNQVNTFNYVTSTFGSEHPGGAQFVLGDGSVQFLSEVIDINAYRQMAVRGDGLPIGGSEF